jgi:hypothetical protein
LLPFRSEPLTSREEQMLMVFENRLMIISGMKRDEKLEAGAKSIVRSFIPCTPHEIKPE